MPRSTSGKARGIRVGSITTVAKPKGSVSDMKINAAETIAMLGWLKPMSPDLICLPEGFLYEGMHFTRAEEVALERNAPIIRRYAELAATCRSYLAVPFLERANDGQVHNAVILYGRDGAVAGTYHKRMLWPSNRNLSEFEKGVIPGHGGGPFRTEFGPIGIQTCLEMHWPRLWTQLGEQGVKIVAFPSQQSGGLILGHRAWDARCFVVSAVSKGGPSHVVGPLGNVLSCWRPDSPSPVIDIPFDFELVHLDYSEDKLGKIASLVSEGLRVSYHYPERIGLVWSENENIKVKSILVENGILTLDQYLEAIDKTHQEQLPARHNLVN